MRQCENSMRDVRCEGIARFFWRFTDDPEGLTMWLCANCYDRLVNLHLDSINTWHASNSAYHKEVLKRNGVKL